MTGRKRPKVTQTRMAGTDHAVITLEGGTTGAYRREPCRGCPWRVDNTGLFPAEAFRHSAPTAYDAAFHTFACHESGSKSPATCAGFLLRNSANNIGVRLAVSGGRIDPSQVTDGGHELHESYRAMAIANGVPADDPAIEPCRDDGDAGWKISP